MEYCIRETRYVQKSSNLSVYTGGTFEVNSLCINAYYAFDPPR